MEDYVKMLDTKMNGNKRNVKKYFVKHILNIEKTI